MFEVRRGSSPPRLGGERRHRQLPAGGRIANILNKQHFTKCFPLLGLWSKISQRSKIPFAMLSAPKKYFEIMRKKSGQERLKIAIQLRAVVLKLAKAAIIDANPKISSEELRNKLQERIYGTGSVIKNSRS